MMDQGKRRRLSHLEVWWFPGEAGHARLGMIVPKFQSNAVARNRLRRRLREIWRRAIKSRVRSGSLVLDIVLRVRREAYGASFGDLEEQLVRWVDGL